MSLTDSVYSRLREMLVSGDLAFGDRVSEVELARVLGTSKAPVRAALARLTLGGLVQVRPQVGTFICQPTRQEVRELVAFRIMIETTALTLAHENAADLVLELARHGVALDRAFNAEDWAAYKQHDTAFHGAIVAASDNRYLAGALETTGGMLEAIRARRTDVGMAVRQQSNADHGLLVDLLRAGRMEEADATLRRHIGRVLSSPWFEELPDHAVLR